MQGMKIRTRLLGVGPALGVALAVAGCGGEKRTPPPPPPLPAALASQLAARSDEVARLLERNDGCAALAAATELQRETIAAINSGRVPARLQESLLGATNDLTVRITCVPPQPPPDEDDDGKDKHGKGNGKGKHGRKGGDD
jgi:hypothetical protein